MSTIKDVARRAGVGVGTASRALSGKGPVSEKAVARVRAAAAQLDYRPSQIARALSLQRSESVGLYVPVFDGWFYASILASVDATLRNAGWHLIVTNGSGPGDSREQALAGLDFLLARGCDGLIVVSHHLRDSDFTALRRRQPHLVAINRTVPRMAAQSFGVDHREGGRLAARALLASGHRMIATVTGLPDALDNQERMAGFREELARHGLEPWAEIEGRFTHASGAAAAERLLAAIDRGKPKTRRCTAVFCANDLMALGLTSRLIRAGWQLPDDLSVVGYDDSDVAAYVTPPLTTVRVPIEDVAAAACTRVLGLCDGVDRPAQRRFDCSIVWRQSVCLGPFRPLGPAADAGTASEPAAPTSARARRGSLAVCP